MTDRPADPQPDIDALLRATMTDDLPPAVEDQLNARVERFLAERRGAGGLVVSMADRFARALPWPMLWQPGLSLRVVGCAVLIASGIALHGLGGPRVFAASVVRVQESVALWTAINSATSLQCTGAAREDFASPAEFAERVYRRWVLVASRSDSTGALRLTFTSPADFAQYDVQVDRQSMLPNRVVKRPLDGATPSERPLAAYDASCHWETRVPGGRTDEQR